MAAAAAAAAANVAADAPLVTALHSVYLQRRFRPATERQHGMFAVIRRKQTEYIQVHTDISYADYCPDT